MKNPFYFETTCETLQPNWIQQPISAGMNFITVMALLLIGIIYRSSLYQHPILIALLSSFIVFETWHFLSHARHGWLPKENQINITHALFYGIIIALALFDFQKGYLQSPSSLLILAFLILLDFYTWFRVRGTWMIVSGVCIALYLVLLMIPHAPPRLYPFLIVISFFIIFAMILVSLEARLCPIVKGFPLHALTEICVLLVFILAALLFIYWCKESRFHRLKYFQQHGKNRRDS